MKIAGIICEFNPFHEGHRYLIDKVRNAGAEKIVCVMSGDFVQRGQPAFCDKFERAHDAVKGGADLVLELPAVYAVNSADYFARGGIRILNRLGCIDTVAFGSECGNIGSLEKCALMTLEEKQSFSDKLRQLLYDGLSYPAAYSAAASELYSEEAAKLLSNPNDTLAVCYLREIMQQRSPMKGWTVQRTFPYSASVIRKERADDPDRKKIDDNLYAVVRSRVLLSSAEQISQVCEVGEGLENRIISALAKAESLDGFVREIKSSRYTYAKVSRILIQMLLGITKETVQAAESSSMAYAKVLAFNERGSEVLKLVQERGSIPVISNINKNIKKDAIEKKFIDIDTNASDLYSILRGRVISDYSDRVRIPIIIK